MFNEKNALPHVRGARLKAVRHALRLSRHEFGQMLNIPPATVQTWEDARFGGLSEKGAKRIHNALQTNNIVCPVEWLLYGVGESPLPQLALSSSLPSSNLETGENIIPTSHNASIVRELNLFHQHYVQAIDAIIADDAMKPVLLEGDYVAGQRFFAKDMQKAVGLPCIVQTKSGQTLVRTLKAGSKEDCYTLVAENPETSAEPVVLHDVELFSAAPVLWIRRKSYA